MVVSDLILGSLIGGIAVIVGGVVGIMGQLIGNQLNHKNKIKYMKSELIFKEKVVIFEKIVGLSWRIHLSLTELELSKKSKEQIKKDLHNATNSFLFIFDKAIYLNKELNEPLGKYIDAFERYVEAEDFGTKESIKKLRETIKPFADKVTKIMQKELDKI